MAVEEKYDVAKTEIHSNKLNHPLDSKMNYIQSRRKNVFAWQKKCSPLKKLSANIWWKIHIIRARAQGISKKVDKKTLRKWCLSSSFSVHVSCSLPLRPLPKRHCSTLLFDKFLPPKLTLLYMSNWCGFFSSLKNSVGSAVKLDIASRFSSRLPPYVLHIRIFWNLF